MRTWQTKANNTAPATTGELTAEEDNTRGFELNNVALTAGLTLDATIGADSDLYMLAQAIARYASGGVYALDTGSANTYVLGGSAVFRMPKAYFDGMRVNWVPGHTNTGPSTANAFTIGAVPILNWNAVALTGGEMVASQEASMVYSVANSAFLLVPWMRYAYTPNLAPPAAPQGYLATTSGTGAINTDATGISVIYYTPVVGNLVPLYQSGQFAPTTISELALTLNSNHLANTIYDVFVFSNAGVPTLATGPAWSNSGGGTSVRGGGSGSTTLSRVAGLWVNAFQIAARNGASTYTIPVGLGTYVGSIFIDGTAGQVSCHLSYGQSRKWGIWNAYNRHPILMKMGDATGSWSYGTSTIRQSRANAGNTAAVFCGLPDETMLIEASQNITLANNGVAAIGIGVDSTTVISGKRGIFTVNAGGALSNAANLQANHQVTGLIGISNINFLESGITGSSTFNGTNADMLMTIGWRG